MSCLNSALQIPEGIVSSIRKLSKPLLSGSNRDLANRIITWAFDQIYPVDFQRNLPWTG